jgi:hypothetical protein
LNLQFPDEDGFYFDFGDWPGAVGTCRRTVSPEPTSQLFF